MQLKPSTRGCARREKHELDLSRLTREATMNSTASSAKTRFRVEGCVGAFLAFVRLGSHGIRRSLPDGTESR